MPSKIQAFLIFCVGLLLLGSCGLPNKTPHESKSKQLLVKYFAGACRGYCPNFEISFYDDKSIQFSGFRNVLHEGDSSLLMDSEHFSLFEEVLKSANLGQADSNYTQPIMDIPLRIFTINEGMGQKEVRFNTSAPKQIENLEKFIIAFGQDLKFLAKTPDELKHNNHTNEVEYIVQMAKGASIDQLREDLSPDEIVLKKKLSPNLEYYLIRYIKPNQNKQEIMDKIRQLSYVVEVQENQKVNERN